MTIHAELEAIRERVEGATEGPWEASPGDEASSVESPAGLITWDDHAGDVFSATDAEFIAHARTDLPKLLRVLEAVLDKTNPIIAGTSDRYRAGRRDMALEIRNIIAEALEIE